MKIEDEIWVLNLINKLRDEMIEKNEKKKAKKKYWRPHIPTSEDIPPEEAKGKYTEVFLESGEINNRKRLSERWDWSNKSTNGCNIVAWRFAEEEEEDEE